MVLYELEDKLASRPHKCNAKVFGIDENRPRISSKKDNVPGSNKSGESAKPKIPWENI